MLSQRTSNFDGLRLKLATVYDCQPRAQEGRDGVVVFVPVRAIPEACTLNFTSFLLSVSKHHPTCSKNG